MNNPLDSFMTSLLTRSNSESIIVVNDNARSPKSTKPNPKARERSNIAGQKRRPLGVLSHLERFKQQVH